MLCRIHWRDLLHDYVRPIQHLCSIQHSKTYALRAVTVKHIGRQKHKNWWSSSSIVKRVCGLLLYSCHRLGIVIPKPRNSRPVQGDAVTGLNELTDPVFPSFSNLTTFPAFSRTRRRLYNMACCCCVVPCGWANMAEARRAIWRSVCKRVEPEWDSPLVFGN